MSGIVNLQCFTVPNLILKPEFEILLNLLRQLFLEDSIALVPQLHGAEGVCDDEFAKAGGLASDHELGR